MNAPRARTLREKFCPNTGSPARLGEVWPARVVVHDLGRRPSMEVETRLYLRHHLDEAIAIELEQVPEPAVNALGVRTPGVEVLSASAVAPVSSEWTGFAVRLRWSSRFLQGLAGRWGRVAVSLRLSAGDITRIFQTSIYLTAGPPSLPTPASLYDDHPHYRWVTDAREPVRRTGVGEHWVELPAPLSRPDLVPALWLQRPDDDEATRADLGPAGVSVVPVFPMEPAVGAGMEVIGWSGALGAHRARPLLMPLVVPADRGRGLAYWNAGTVAVGEPAGLEEATACVWPEIRNAEPAPVRMFQLRPIDGPLEVKRDLRFRLADESEPVMLVSGELWAGAQVVGRWLGPATEVYAGRDWSLAFSVDQHAIAAMGHERIKLSARFRGVPHRGHVAGPMEFRTEDGPYAEVHTVRPSEEERRPWIAIDLGTEGTTAALAFFDGFAPRVQTLEFADGFIYPSRVNIESLEDGSWTLTERSGPDTLYTTGIKMGLRFGDGAHPGCPDHISAVDVGRFHLKRFLLEVRERASWFPLEQADVLVSFPPRLATLPRFVASLKQIFETVLPEVLWPSGVEGRIWYREEAFLVAMPSLYRDLAVTASPGSIRRFYWVMDFGGGTTDVAGFLCEADEDGEEFAISEFRYPQRIPHHLSGNDVTAAFYTVLRQAFAELGLLTGAKGDQEQRTFVLPADPFPSTRSTRAALGNQAVIRELADRIKCAPDGLLDESTVLDHAMALSSGVLLSVAERPTTLVSLLHQEAAPLGQTACAAVHQWVLGRSAGPTDATAHRTATPVGPATTVPRTLFLKQGRERYRVADWVTANRWFRERRIDATAEISENGRDWTPLIERAEFEGLEEVMAVREAADSELEIEGGALGAAIVDFVDACRLELEAALSRLPAGRPVDVRVLLAGRGSRFEPVREAVFDQMPGRVLHLTSDWVARTYGRTGTIDAQAGLKTLTVNGGGLFALNQSHEDMSQLQLRFRTDSLDCPAYLRTGSEEPQFLASSLPLREGARVAATVGDDGVPVGTPLLGTVRVQVAGLPVDQEWEPWVTVARGVAARVDGKRLRTTEELSLSVSGGVYELRGLTGAGTVELQCLLPHLDLLGEI